MENDRRILITGGAGFIGSWAAAALRRANWTVGIFDRNNNTELLNRVSGPGNHPPITTMVGDIRDPDSVLATIQEFRPLTVLHLAAALIPFCQSNPSLGANINIVGTVNVFEAAKKARVQRVIYSSSAAAHVRGDSNALTSLYGAYKLACEEIAQVYWAVDRLPSVGLKPSVVYGYGRGMTRAEGGGMTAALNYAIIAAIRGEPYEIPLGGYYRFESIDEVADVIVRCASAPIDGAILSDITSKATSVAEFVGLLKRMFPHSQVTMSENPPARRTVEADVVPLQKLIGEWPHVDLVAGINQLAERLQKDTPNATNVTRSP